LVTARADPAKEPFLSVPTVRLARGNRLLAGLPRDALERLIPALESRPLAVRDVLQHPGAALEEVIFPLDGVASMITVSASGNSLEVATVGSEGMVGLPLFLGGSPPLAEVFIQVAGSGLFMSAQKFRKHVAAEPSLVRMLLPYTQALMTQVAQCAVCIKYHPTPSRCARWVLQTHDRVRGRKFQLTHEFLSLMLGVRRASVSEAAKVLQQDGLMSYRRGVVTVLDRAGLERACCECYPLIRREYNRLLKPRRSVAAV
jgi:CRP-like cAMP-binding protein